MKPKGPAGGKWVARRRWKKTNLLADGHFDVLVVLVGAEVGGGSLGRREPVRRDGVDRDGVLLVVLDEARQRHQLANQGLEAENDFLVKTLKLKFSK